MPYGTINADLITTSDGVSAAGLYGMKNRIINGAMVIDQRNAGASVTNTNGVIYSIDRWAIGGTVTSKFTQQRNAASVTPPVGFTNYLGITSSSAYSVLTADYFTISQPIEGLNIADFAWGTAYAATVTLSFWVRSSLTGTFGGSIVNSAGNRSYPFTYTISSANTWEKETITIAGDTSGTWLTTNGVGLYLVLGLGAGATFSGTAGTWASANYQSATGATSVVGTNGATFYITGVQLEKGSTATSFDYRPYGTELALCQRYFERMGGDAAGDIWCSWYAVAGSNQLGQTVYYKATKRAIPTATKVGTWTVSNCGQPTLAGTTGTNSAGFSAVAGAAGLVQYYTASSSTYLTFDAEL
jgi:hypothetical protein